MLDESLTFGGIAERAGVTVSFIADLVDLDLMPDLTKDGGWELLAIICRAAKNRKFISACMLNLSPYDRLLAATFPHYGECEQAAWKYFMTCERGGVRSDINEALRIVTKKGTGISYDDAHSIAFKVRGDIQNWKRKKKKTWGGQMALLMGCE